MNIARREFANLPMNLVFLILAPFVAYGRLAIVQVWGDFKTLPTQAIARCRIFRLTPALPAMPIYAAGARD